MKIIVYIPFHYEKSITHNNRLTNLIKILKYYDTKFKKKITIRVICNNINSKQLLDNIKLKHAILNLYIPHRDFKYFKIQNIQINDLTVITVELMKLHKIQNKYDIYIYHEDDILIPYTTLFYWIKDVATLWKYGFIRNVFRVEIKDENLTDQIIPSTNNNKKQTNQLDNFIYLKDYYPVTSINNTTYIQLPIPYSACFILNNNQFNYYLNSKQSLCDLNISNNPLKWEIRELTASGLQFDTNLLEKHTNFISNAVIPITGNTLPKYCIVYHLEQPIGFDTTLFYNINNYKIFHNSICDCSSKQDYNKYKLKPTIGDSNKYAYVYLIMKSTDDYLKYLHATLVSAYALKQQTNIKIILLITDDID